ncbi:MAG: aspartate kinase [Chlamydiales bacterium]|nr:aspartate kinase [Chlamydiales bacterium]
MPQEKKTLIMKFGGAAVKNPESFSRLAELILERKKEYSRIVAVVSAMRGMTDHLISLALQVNPSPPRREYDMLVSVGERVSISLLAMALAAKNASAVSFTGSQSGILTTDAHSEARIITVRPGRLIPHLEEGKVVIVAGFQGVSESKEITTLGRGGSDTSAVALAIALGAEKVEFYKDVKGIFSKDPIHDPQAFFYSILTFEEALEVVLGSGGKVIHPRALLLAQKNNLPLHVRSFLELDGEGTLITAESFEVAKAVYE